MNAPLNFAAFEALTFDCYGTLIDWESGILNALRPIFDRHGVNVSSDELLEAYAIAESAAESGPFKPYRRVLEVVVSTLGERFGFTPAAEECRSLSESVGTWQPFPDTIDSLRRLQRRYKLSVISNIDDDLFARTAKLLGVNFDFVTTALEVGSYKPSFNNFRGALAKMNLDENSVLHVAQSLHHDIKPARALGIHCVWVNRREGKGGSGATVASSAIPDVEVPDLRSLTELVDSAEVPVRR